MLATMDIGINKVEQSKFGYDAVFIPDAADQTFAEMTLEEKNRFSHRKKATDLLVTFLNTINKKN